MPVETNLVYDIGQYLVDGVSDALRLEKVWKYGRYV